ncbi:MAG: flagellar basal body-associated protein FliL [Pseudomonadota bacterium]|nr:flagellar basal body-associated protein FliL [Pseudomonadota bacterium]
MAQKEVVEDSEELEESAPLNKKPKRFLKLVLLIFLIIAVAAGGWYGWKIYSAKHDKAHAGQSRLSRVPPVFLKLDMFTVNLRDTDADRYLQIEINLQLADSKVENKIKAIMPEVRNTLLLLLSSQTSANIRTAEGKQKLATEIRDSVNKLLVGTSGANGVKNVLFNSFIVQ